MARRSDGLGISQRGRKHRGKAAQRPFFTTHKREPRTRSPPLDAPLVGEPHSSLRGRRRTISSLGAIPEAAQGLPDHMCPSATTSEVGGALNGSVRMKLFASASSTGHQHLALGVVAADARAGRHAAGDAVGADAVAHDAAARSRRRRRFARAPRARDQFRRAGRRPRAARARRAAAPSTSTGTTPAPARGGDGSASAAGRCRTRAARPTSRAWTTRRPPPTASCRRRACTTGARPPLPGEDRLRRPNFLAARAAAAPVRGRRPARRDKTGRGRSSARGAIRSPDAGAAPGRTPTSCSSSTIRSPRWGRWRTARTARRRSRARGGSSSARRAASRRTGTSGSSRSSARRSTTAPPHRPSIQPKLFAHMHDVVNLSYQPRQCALAPHPHTFALEVMGTPRTRSRSVVTGTDARGKPSGMRPPLRRFGGGDESMAHRARAPPVGAAVRAGRRRPAPRPPPGAHPALFVPADGEARPHADHRPHARRRRRPPPPARVVARRRHPRRRFGARGKRTPVEWFLGAVRKCMRSMDLARCLEKNVIGDGTPLGII